MGEQDILDHGNSEKEVMGPKWLHVVRDHVHSLRFGTVVVTVHEGRVVQVERTEKLRLDQETSEPSKKAPSTATPRAAK